VEQKATVEQKDRKVIREPKATVGQKDRKVIREPKATVMQITEIIMER